ncbi:MAG TPA: NADH-quinone oxidoreductase subunit A [Armatimonadota bacterium]|nr:NADH-quinone oxidoreductase subunit A [Armatimonadota bacterium]HPT96814.1 NADH-quinone oxidoreductase subunit A [Armatimonadota bacterium]
MPTPISASPAADWLPVAVFFFIAVVVSVVMIVIPRMIGPGHPTPQKTRPYECGERVVGMSWPQMHIGYYLYAFVFIIFDVEVVFLWPWVRVVGGRLVQAHGLGLFAFLDMLVFVTILVVGLVYAWRKGVLRWE